MASETCHISLYEKICLDKAEYQRVRSLEWDSGEHYLRGAPLEHLMESLVLDICEYLGSVVRHNCTIAKEHRIHRRNQQRISIQCSRGAECSFRVNAVLLSDGAGLRIMKFE